MKLIINADDFGLSKSITDGIIYGIKEGFVTSTTLMANMEYTEYAIKEALKNNINCIGLHVNFSKGKPIIENKKLTDKNGKFLSRYEQLKNNNIKLEDAYNEIKAQLKRIDELSNGKLKIDHFDAHHFMMNNYIIKKAVETISKELSIPVRNENNINAKCPDIMYEDFSLTNVNIDAIKKMIDMYKNTNKVIELMVHPGFIDEYTRNITSYLKREEEINVLKHAKESGIFDEIELISFSEF